MTKNKLKKEIQEKRRIKRDKYPSIGKILLEATQHAYSVGESGGEEYESFYPKLEEAIDQVRKEERERIRKEVIERMPSHDAVQDYLHSLKDK